MGDILRVYIRAQDPFITLWGRAKTTKKWGSRECPSKEEDGVHNPKKKNKDEEIV